MHESREPQGGNAAQSHWLLTAIRDEEKEIQRDGGRRELLQTKLANLGRHFTLHSRSDIHIFAGGHLDMRGSLLCDSSRHGCIRICNESKPERRAV